jgi:hypothetical protein
MQMSIGPAIILLGIMLLVGSQLAIAFHAFSRNPLLGLLCLIVPLYVYVYARKHKVGILFMRVWYVAIALLAIGGILSS